MEARLPPLLFRVYCGSLQRQISSIRSLNSHAAYVVVLDDDALAAVWVGSMCSEGDRDLALHIAGEIMLQDFGEDSKNDIPTLYEAEAIDELLDALLDLLGSDSNTYSSKALIAERREDIENATVSVGALIPSSQTVGDFEQNEKSFAHPDVEGSVPRVEFIYIERDSLAYIVVGNQYDLWIARGVPEDQQQYAVAFMERLIDRDVFEDAPATTNKTRFLPHLQVVYQGEERYAFRRLFKIFTEFEPIGRTAPKVEIPLPPAPPAAASQDARKVKGGVSFAQVTVEDAGDENDENDAGGDNDRRFAQQRAAAMSAIRRADAGKAARLPVTFSEFRLEEERDNLAPRASDMADARMLQLQRPLNFWQDVKPQQAQRVVLFGEFSPDNPDYAPPPKARLHMGDRTRILPQHFDILEHENLDLTARKDLLMRAKHDPDALLGWQIEIDEGLYCGIYVIIGYKKSTVMRKTSFQAIAKDMSEHWLRLRRGRVKRGLVFRPLRQVARVLTETNENLAPTMSFGKADDTALHTTTTTNTNTNMYQALPPPQAQSQSPSSALGEGVQGAAGAAGAMRNVKFSAQHVADDQYHHHRTPAIPEDDDEDEEDEDEEEDGDDDDSFLAVRQQSTGPNKQVSFSAH